MIWMKIGEVARRSAFRTSAIRYYERLGLLPEPSRVGGQRRYDAQILERLAIVRFARAVGFSVTETKLLLFGFQGRPPPHRWREMATKKIDEIDAVIAHAQSIKGMLEDTLRHKCPKLAERGSAVEKASSG